MKTFKKSIYAMIVILAFGCATFKGNKLPLVQQDEYIHLKKEKVKVFSRWKYEAPQGIDAVAMAAVHKSWFDKAMIESGCCEIVEGPKEAQLVIDGIGFDNTSPWLALPRIFNASSLTVIPFWQTVTFELKVSASKGNKSNSYELKDTVTLVSWLPMIFVFPFTGGPTKNKEEVLLNTYQTLVVNLRKDGYL
ncbi:Hypothetical protein LBF_1640 [Leptospira biflexa serovar Patoc strain 'Patoc 1 (Ames)']|uniref:Lipoprotein n=1 Tax=Leptospira biflexa serovar Patoc (strain Patoc 1 / ATCC 23582 / Paris) TaxID=456481 RepID=B0SRK3_LEPBP|nr:hypothetical protein [Leptospira biflexa]ABZ94147.1 Hypothetical protein LBF_1640 [Leptospira biflexa serovar Patoc strain 'Patoc 1 (Ames)']ABZ97798.1 Hypothetical protein; putative signal peptide [Leptospira biflexa serovar Patoc strain 'Patoc 1 (Paris)']